ncbi:TPA: hypothetical protein JBI85_13900 [Legionella pneumophila]|nr:hypothetical protein [Legionella pneumophila]
MQINVLRKWYRLVVMVSVFGLTGCYEGPATQTTTPSIGANAANQNNTQTANTANNGAVAPPAPPAPPAATIEITTCINV